MFTIKEVEDNLARCQKFNDGEPWCLSASGKMIRLTNPSFTSWSRETLAVDIAYHLSNLSRFTGAVKRQSGQIYSVAQHCMFATSLAMDILDDEPIDKNSSEYYDQLLAVALHDADEFAVNDVSSPVKRAIHQAIQVIRIEI